MARDMAAYMREYRARKAAEAAGQIVEHPKRGRPPDQTVTAQNTASEPTYTETGQGVLFDREEVAEQVVRHRRSSRGGNQYSLDDNFKGEPSDITRAIHNATKYIKAEPCKDDEDFANRIESYFADCAENGIIPRWETLALALGITRQRAWMIANGRETNQARCKMLERAKDILSAIDAELVQTGKVNPVVYIFRAELQAAHAVMRVA